MPGLRGVFGFHHAMRLQGDEGAEDGGDGLTGGFGEFRKCEARMGGEQGKEAKRAVERLNGILIGLVVEGLWAASRFCRHRQASGSGEKAQRPDFVGGWEDFKVMKNVFEKIVWWGCGG
jgi:hypothetical protein